MNHFRSLVRRAGADERTDTDLLADAPHDEAAFAELVARHGPVVWGVCRHLLGEADAEDAFQATFVALLRSPGRDPAALGAWLHRVAVRVALTARRAAARRRARETAAARPEAAHLTESDEWADTMAVVHREVAALPDVDRAAFVLCVLEGRTQSDAAARLGRTPGAVAGQVARAKKRLVARLTARGVAPGLAALGVAVVPPAVAARVLTLPGAGVPPAILRLARGGLGMTTANNWVALATAVVVAGLAAWVVAAGDLPPAPPPAAAARPPEPAGGDAPKLVRTLAGHLNRITSLAYAPDGTAVATASWDGTVRLWDVKAGAEVRRFGFDEAKGDKLQTGELGANTYDQVAFTPDGARVVAAKRLSDTEFATLVWDRRTGAEVYRFPSGGGACFDITPRGGLIACGGYRHIGVYDLATGKAVHDIPGDEKQLRIESLTFSPDGKTMYSTGHPPTPQPDPKVFRLTIMPDVVRCWDVTTGFERPSPLNGQVVTRLGQHVGLSPDGRTLVHPNGKGVTLREVATNGERGKLTGHKDEACDFVYSPDGRTLATGSMDGTVCLWDVPGGKQLARLGKDVDPVKGGWILSVAFSPDGRTLVGGGLDKTASVWDVSAVTGRKHGSAPRTPADLDADWAALAGSAAAGYAALGRFVAAPDVSVPFLAKQLEAAATADAAPVDRLIGKLGDADFATREAASKELAALGDRAEHVLRKALAGTPSAEARRRLGVLVSRLAGAAASPGTAREIRAVEALELIGTPDARRALDHLAAGPAGVRLTDEAKASADRLAGRSR